MCSPTLSECHGIGQLSVCVCVTCISRHHFWSQLHCCPVSQCVELIIIQSHWSHITNLGLHKCVGVLFQMQMQCQCWPLRYFLSGRSYGKFYFIINEWVWNVHLVFCCNVFMHRGHRECTHLCHISPNNQKHYTITHSTNTSIMKWHCQFNIRSILNMQHVQCVHSTRTVLLYSSFCW